MESRKIIRAKYILGCFTEVVFAATFLNANELSELRFTSNAGHFFIMNVVIGILFSLKELVIPYVIIADGSIKKFSWYKYISIQIEQVIIGSVGENEIVLFKKSNNERVMTVYFYGISESDKLFLLKSLKSQ